MLKIKMNDQKSIGLLVLAVVALFAIVGLVLLFEKAVIIGKLTSDYTRTNYGVLGQPLAYTEQVDRSQIAQSNSPVVGDQKFPPFRSRQASPEQSADIANIARKKYKSYLQQPNQYVVQTPVAPPPQSVLPDKTLQYCKTGQILVDGKCTWLTYQRHK